MYPKLCRLIRVGTKMNKYYGRIAIGTFSDYVLEIEMPFYGFNDEDNPIISTTPVLHIIKAGETVIFETKNSIYWLVPYL